MQGLRQRFRLPGHLGNQQGLKHFRLFIQPAALSLPPLENPWHFGQGYKHQWRTLKGKETYAPRPPRSATLS